MAKLVIGITTAPRRPNYLQQTLRTVQFAVTQRAADIHIFAEPLSEPLPIPCATYHANPKRLGNWHNWLATAKWLLNNTDADHIITMEDDVLLTPLALLKADMAMEEFGDKQIGLLSLYTCGAYQRRYFNNLPNDPVLGYNTPQEAAKAAAEIRAPECKTGRCRTRLPVVRRLPSGLHALNPVKLWGACCWLFQREILHKIVFHPLAQTWNGGTPQPRPPEKIIGTDVAVGNVVRALHLPMYFFQPSLAQHIGRHSTVGNGAGLTQGRRALDFAG